MKTFGYNIKLSKLQIMLLVICLIAIGFYMDYESRKFYDYIRGLHYEEICRVLTDAGGKVTSIELYGLPKEGLDVGGRNSLYKVNYEKNGTEYIAWYRGVNLEDIHGVDSKSYPEQWVFEPSNIERSPK